MGKRLTGHLSVQKGKKVQVHMKDGTSFIDKFKEKKGAFVILEGTGKIHARNISTLSIYKPNHEEVRIQGV